MNKLIKYAPKLSYTLAFFLLLGACVLLMVGRWSSFLTGIALFLDSGFQKHLSNFSISLFIYLIAGYAGLLRGIHFFCIIGFGVLLVLSNFICETLVFTMNTPDMADAIYGTLGSALAFLYLLTTKLWGLRPFHTKRV
jgi:hypothetical protein